jgi:hypothetical protein
VDFIENFPAAFPIAISFLHVVFCGALIVPLRPSDDNHAAQQMAPLAGLIPCPFLPRRRGRAASARRVRAVPSTSIEFGQ